MSPFRSASTVRVGLGSLLAIGLSLGCLTSTSRADFCYAWTELSLEWITDASSAIALGEVVDAENGGGFTFRTDTVLKRAPGFSLQASDLVKGACLGRSTINENLHGNRFPLLTGRPVYSEPATHPGDNCVMPGRMLPLLGSLEYLHRTPWCEPRDLF